MKNHKIAELSPVQQAAVTDFQGPCLIIAGAGSGKTRVLTHRIAYMLDQGVAPRQVLALTFTNKAAKEMKERVCALIDSDAPRRLWMGTFHSVFARILRKEAEALGLPSSFTIYDKTDSKNVIKACIKEMQLDEKIYAPGEVMNRIGKAKNNLVSAAAYRNHPVYIQEDRSLGKPLIADIYERYAKQCKLAGAMDFDDILLYTHSLFHGNPACLARYADQFHYILVDEYQDTNSVQYHIIRLLSGGHGNITVVGDDSQSIYAFRGARIENILHFKRDFPQTKEYRLEQNYRSTQTLVNAANSLIEHNNHRLEKKCFSTAALGDKIKVVQAYTDQEEAYLVASGILGRLQHKGGRFQDFAVLYRTNAQSRSLEEALRKRNIPYKIYGNLSFYERAEVKDLLAYCRLLINPQDDEAFKRVINVPARGIGRTSLLHLTASAAAEGLSLWDFIHSPAWAACPIQTGAKGRIQAFVQMIEANAALEEANAFALANAVAVDSGYMAALRQDNSLEGKARMENVEELFNSLRFFCDHAAEALETEVATEEEAPAPTLDRFLSNIALMSQLDEQDQDQADRVSLMTIHASKGLEFNNVFIVGMEERLFPSPGAADNPRELEEERRLFYVAMTRAKTSLTLTYALNRMRWGNRESNPPSRFVKEIDPNYLEMEGNGGRPSASQPRPQPKVRPRPQARPAERPLPPPPRPASAGPFVAHNPDLLHPGDRIEHERFGKGTVQSREGRAPDLKMVITFDVGGTKTLLMKYAKVRKLN